jgi:predicted RND superfamily exporter protein
VTQIVDLILLELERIGVIAFIFVLIFISFSVHNFKSILIIVAPLLISIFWTFSILGWLGIKINIINSIISVFIFGLVIDYSIFLVSSFKNKQSNFSHTSGGAILISALTTMIGLGALVFAGHPALHSLGLTALIGISSGLIAVIFFVPVVLYKK